MQGNQADEAFAGEKINWLYNASPVLTGAGRQIIIAGGWPCSLRCLLIAARPASVLLCRRKAGPRMGVFVELSVLAIRQIAGSAASKVPGGAPVASTVASALERHFTNHSRQLSLALAKSTERAWRALELSLAGDGLWDRGKGLLCGGNQKAFRKQAKLFLDTVAAPQLPADPQFRPACLREIRAAREAGVLSSGELDPADLSRRVGVFAGLLDAPAVLDAEWRILDHVAEQFPSNRYPHLQQLLRLRAADGPPLLAVAARYFFRIEVQADDALFKGLSFDALGRVEKSQQEGFDALNELLAQHADLLDDLLGCLAQTHAAVLDLRAEQGRWGCQLHEIYDQLIDLKAKLDLPSPRLRPRDTVSIRTNAERKMVRKLLARFRALPPEQRQRAPALLNGLGMLEAAAAQSPDDPGLANARQIFKEVAAEVPDALARAEAHHNDHRAALEQRNWPEALAALRRCVESAPEQFAPFPFDRYEPLAILGAGAFGTAFLCRHVRLKSQLVVKSLNPSELQRDVDELFREAQVLEELDHPGIIRVRDADYADAAHARPYLVMDYFDGVDLEEHVKRHGVLPVPGGLDFARQLGEAVAALHAKGLLHRDLTPTNVLVKVDSSGVRIKLIDFGLALHGTALPGTRAWAASGNTRIPSSIAGSLDYAAPEQIGRLEGASVGPYSDVYGWAKTCCWALCKTAQPLPHHFRRLPHALADLLEDCIAEEPSGRPAGFAVVLERLKGVKTPAAIHVAAASCRWDSPRLEAAATAEGPASRTNSSALRTAVRSARPAMLHKPKSATKEAAEVMPETVHTPGPSKQNQGHIVTLRFPIFRPTPLRTTTLTFGTVAPLPAKTLRWPPVPPLQALVLQWKRVAIRPNPSPKR
jgi:serine/threonine protein kinase